MIGKLISAKETDSIEEVAKRKERKEDRQKKNEERKR